MKSSEFPEEFPRKFRGSSNFGFPRNFLGIYRRNSEETLIRRYIPRKFRGISDEKSPRNIPRKFISSEFRRKFPRDFRGKMNFRGVISEDFFRPYVVGIALFRQHTDDFFPQYAAVFL
ncbi:hypothetical protein F2Q69_00001032 [Brassica cretica]|uniref:Uncharacterized protein n=1 Tax=Brassica cretica TaxID=69181 RepID=A0A8S9P9X7_BRACR|nr:hypothetical protein F2Q69_00001032 [Brassica cretica]